MGNPAKDELVDVLWDASGFERPSPVTTLSPDAQRRNQVHLYQLYQAWVRRKDSGATIFLPPQGLLEVIARYPRNFRTIMARRLSLATTNSYLIHLRIARFLRKHMPSDMGHDPWTRSLGARMAPSLTSWPR